MGWSSGSRIFDAVAEKVLNESVPEETQIEIITALIEALEEQDWDTQGESDYFEHPIVRRIFEAANPEWYEEWEEIEEDD